MTLPTSFAAFQKLIELHDKLVQEDPYTYFELAYTRQTGYMAFICDRPAEGIIGSATYGENRTILAKGQGDSAEEACAEALKNYIPKGYNSGSTKPEKVGMYFRKCENEEFYSKWDGTCWLDGAYTVERASRSTVPSCLQDIPWKEIT